MATIHIKERSLTSRLRLAGGRSDARGVAQTKTPSAVTGVDCGWDN
jgi:hypothetical protein